VRHCFSFYGRVAFTRSKFGWVEQYARGVVNLFDSNSDDEAHFLKALHEQIDNDEFALLAKEGGFTDPNKYISVDEFEQVLASHKFPNNNLYEYIWAIYESGYSRLKQYSTWMQLFLASLFVYSDKRKQWSTSISSDYHYLVLLLAIQNPDSEKIGTFYLSFLEWLESEIKPDIGFDNYYCLLSWLLMRRLTNTVDHPKFLAVLDILEKREYTTEQLETLTVSDRSIESWLKLHSQIPCPNELEERFEQVIFGI
jgi:hypothetical protein